MSVAYYICPNHDQILHCEVDEAGERVCPTCGAAVTAVTNDGEGDDR